jgi:hypothetical protein
MKPGPPKGSAQRGGKKPTSLLDRIRRRIKHEGDCWVWQGSLMRGYGHIRVGTNKTNDWVKAHRAVYELLVGPIPEGFSIDHLCRNRACVNPAHLEPVTVAENNRRQEVRHGEAHPKSKLTVEVVRQIRASSLPHTHLAVQFGVDPKTIARVRSGATWASA